MGTSPASGALRGNPEVGQVCAKGQSGRATVIP